MNIDELHNKLAEKDWLIEDLTEVDFLLIAHVKEIIEQQFSLQGVVASLLCVDSEGLSFIMEGETYNLLEESDTLYKISDDDGDEFWYDKKNFVKNEK